MERDVELAGRPLRRRPLRPRLRPAPDHRDPGLERRARRGDRHQRRRRPPSAGPPAPRRRDRPPDPRDPRRGAGPARLRDPRRGRGRGLSRHPRRHDRHVLGRKHLPSGGGRGPEHPRPPLRRISPAPGHRTGASDSLSSVPQVVRRQHPRPPGEHRPIGHRPCISLSPRVPFPPAPLRRPRCSRAGSRSDSGAPSAAPTPRRCACR